MRKEKKAALNVLDKAADAYNCWSILDEAVTSGEDDGFTRKYINSERMMLVSAISKCIRALKKLGKRYGIKLTACIEMKTWRADE